MIDFILIKEEVFELPPYFWNHQQFYIFFKSQENRERFPVEFKGKIFIINIWDYI